MPSNGSRKSTVKAPPLGELNRGVLYAFQVLPPSLVARTLAIVAPPVAIQAFLPPCVVTQVPLDAKENSPGNAGGILALISCHVCPSSVVTVKVPARPDAQTTCGFTGQTAIRPLVVPLFCGVSLG